MHQGVSVFRSEKKAFVVVAAAAVQKFCCYTTSHLSSFMVPYVRKRKEVAAYARDEMSSARPQA